MSPLIREHAALVPFNPVEYVWIDFASSPMPTVEESREITRRLGELPYSYQTFIGDWPLPFEKMVLLLPVMVRGETTPRGTLTVTMERDGWTLKVALWGNSSKGKVSPSVTLVALHNINEGFKVFVDPEFARAVRKTEEQCADYGTEAFRTAWRRIMAMAVLNQPAAAVASCTGDAVINAKRKRNGKRPFFEWTTVEVKPRAVVQESKGGTHASPKPHMRRGHVRRYKSGKVVAIKPMIVNKSKMPDEGFIFHDYQVTVPT